jgi:EAL domain-containing protein (putative c-di-GMP-specific phosphodiesterase class I)
MAKQMDVTPHTATETHSYPSIDYTSDYTLTTDLSSLLGTELRTPLDSVRGVLSLLTTGELGSLSDTGRHLVKVAMQNADRLMRLMETIEQEFKAKRDTFPVKAIEYSPLAIDLRLAWDRHEFQLFYQPITCLETGKTTGFEALARWHHPTRGWVCPTVFIPFAEQIGLMDRLGYWVLSQACRQLSIWQQEFPSHPPLTMSVNLSSWQLTQPDLVERVERICRDAAISPQHLCLEITESSFIEDCATAITSLHQLKQLGVRLYLDDFGTGYSSLSRLRNLPVDMLKIDRTFVSQQQWEVIWSILLLAESLGLETIAEGVETQEELEKLKLLGCKHVQGFLFSPPVNYQAAAALLPNFTHR